MSILALMLLTISAFSSRNLMFKFSSFPSSAIANQESLSGLETEMRKLEGLVKEIVDEMGYLKKREERFTDTNSAYSRYCIRIRSIKTSF